MNESNDAAGWKPEDDEVPVTGALLSFFLAFAAAKQVYFHERLFTLGMEGVTPSEEWRPRLRRLFFEEWAPAVKALGLKANEQTFAAAASLRIPEELYDVSSSNLPRVYSFSPWADQGRGAIVGARQAGGQQKAG